MTRRPEYDNQLFPGNGRLPGRGPVGSGEKLTGVALAAALLLSACSSSSPSASTPPATTSTRTVVITHSATARSRPYAPPPASTVRPLAPGAKPPSGEKKGRCPYIRAGLDVEPGPEPTVADIEGDRVGRVTVLTSYHPVGCRFYFAYPSYEAIADILPTTFGTTAQARDAMIRTARAGSTAQTYPNVVAGVTGISYRTRFFGEDGTRDWAFVFATGKVTVVVHAQQTTSSSNARYLAAAIAGKF